MWHAVYIIILNISSPYHAFKYILNMVCKSNYPLCAINKVIDKGKIVRRIEWKILGIHSIISNMQEANNSLSFFSTRIIILRYWFCLLFSQTITFTMHSLFRNNCGFVTINSMGSKHTTNSTIDNIRRTNQVTIQNTVTRRYFNSPSRASRFRYCCIT